MKKRINLLYMIMALVTIVASVSIACTVFYNVLKHEVLEDMHNYIDVFIGADAWGMVTDPDNIVEQKVIDNYDGNLRITFINSQGYAVVDTLVDIDKMENHNERPEVVAARRKDPQQVPSDDHGNGTHQQHGAEPSEHPDPYGTWQNDPQSLYPGRWICLCGCRLLPDRAACAGTHFRG